MGRTEAVGNNVRVASVALLCIGLIAAVGAASGDLVDAKKKEDRRVGTYRGTIDADDAVGVGGGTISFRFTKNRKIVGFTAADIPQLCDIEPADFPGQRPPTTPKGTVTFGAPKMSVQGAARFFYRSHEWDTGPHPAPGPYTYIEVSGKPGGSARTIKGYVIYLSATATADGSSTVPGTETCFTYKVNWTAERKK